MNTAFQTFRPDDFQPPALPLYRQKKGVIIDIDDTMLASEEGHMARSWNALLRPWNVVWQKFDDSDPAMRSITEAERPGVGKHPLDVVKHFMTKIENLDMSPQAAEALGNSQYIYELGVSPNDFDSINEEWTSLSPEEQIDKWAKMLEKARGGLGLELVRKYGVKEIPGSTDMVRQIHNAGYNVSFVTQANLHMAQEMLYQLGIIRRLPDGSYTGDYEILVAGDMVKNPKPNPEPHDRMIELMRGLWRIDTRVIAMIGDSGSDVNFAYNLGLPKAFIRESQYLSPEKRQQMIEKLGDRLMFVPGWEGFDVVKHLDEISTSIEGGRPSGLERM